MGRMIYIDLTPLDQMFTEVPAALRRPRQFPTKMFYLYNERSQAVLAQAPLISLWHAKRKWHPVAGQAIYCEEAGDLQCCWRPA